MTNNNEILATQKLFAKPTKKGLRVWIEGKRLQLAGFNRYDRYTRVITDNAIVYTLNDNGCHKVAGRTRNNKDLPIIDLVQASIANFKANDTLTATYQTGIITITKQIGE